MFRAKKSKYIASLILGAVFIFVLFFFLFDIKKVKGSSMLSSFKEGDVLLIFRATYGLKSPFSNRYLIRWRYVKKGDVVMYKIKGHYVIKRCYATDKDVIYFYQRENVKNTDYFMKIE